MFEYLWIGNINKKFWTIILEDLNSKCTSLNDHLYGRERKKGIERYKETSLDCTLIRSFYLSRFSTVHSVHKTSRLLKQEVQRLRESVLAFIGEKIFDRVVGYI